MRLTPMRSRSAPFCIARRAERFMLTAEMKSLSEMYLFHSERKKIFFFTLKLVRQFPQQGAFGC